jgi:alpha-L-fucosidase 2
MSPEDLGANGPAPRRPGPGTRCGPVPGPQRRERSPTEVRDRGGGGTMASVGYAGISRTVRVRPGGSGTLRELA